MLTVKGGFFDVFSFYIIKFRHKVVFTDSGLYNYISVKYKQMPGELLNFSIKSLIIGTKITLLS